MKVLSFDIGIKNLAYCVIEDTTHTIESWGILNISAEESCSHVSKGSLVSCENTAKYRSGETCLCPSHHKLKMYQELTCKKIPKVKNPTLEIGKNIARLLDTHPEFLEVDLVLLENQPALKNPTMKSVQMLVYGYFLVKGIMTDSPIQNIQMINARNKLKAYQGPPIPCDIKDTYKKTKYLGIKYCESMITQNKDISEEWLTLFSSSRKKDDLSDAYLQGMFVLTKITKNTK